MYILTKRAPALRQGPDFFFSNFYIGDWYNGITPDSKSENRGSIPLSPAVHKWTHGHTVLFPYLARPPPPAWMATMRDRGGARPNYKTAPMKVRMEYEQKRDGTGESGKAAEVV